MIVIPMAGLSRRFTEAGYKVPKYMLRAHGRSMFAHAVASFSAYFASERFLFIVRDVAGTSSFLRAECQALGIGQTHVTVLDEATSGQAETVTLGLRDIAIAAEEPLTIFNIDTFRPGFQHASFDGQPTDGYLEVFRGSGDNWSYVRPVGPDSNVAAETAEKRPISDLCCTGLYHFATKDLYLSAYDTTYRSFAPSAALKERYIAPMYNALIAEGKTIRYQLIDRHEVIFCGVPDEFDAFLAGPAPG